MALLEDLKSLARLPRSSAPFLSLYLNARWDSEKQREKVRIFVKTKVKECLACSGGPGQENARGMQEDAEKLENYVKGLVNREWDEAYSGVAVFACSSLGVYRVVRSYLPFDEFFACADRPILRPVAEQAHWGESAVLALVSGDAGRLVEFQLGGVRREFSFEDEDFPGRHEQGGWSQARYQRHVDDHLHRNLKRLARRLVKWVDERRIQRILVSGPDPLLSTFEDHLPKRIRSLVCANIRTDPRAGFDVMQEEALVTLRRAREKEDRQSIDAVLDKGVGTGRALTRPEPVAEAVAAGRVHVLYLDREFQDAGWKCFDCGALGIRVPLGCPRCGAAVEGVDLGEELIRGTLATDGKVVPVEGHEGLRAERGVAAVLRYT